MPSEIIEHGKNRTEQFLIDSNMFKTPVKIHTLNDDDGDDDGNDAKNAALPPTQLNIHQMILESVMTSKPTKFWLQRDHIRYQ